MYVRIVAELICRHWNCIAKLDVHVYEIERNKEEYPQECNRVRRYILATKIAMKRPHIRSVPSTGTSFNTCEEEPHK